MTITAKPTDLELELIPPNPWAAVWSPPARDDVNNRHEWTRRHQAEGWIPSQGGSRNRLGDVSPPPSSPAEPKPVVHQTKRAADEQRSARRRRLRAFRIAIATTAIGLIVAAAAAAYWYLA